MSQRIYRRRVGFIKNCQQQSFQGYQRSLNWQSNAFIRDVSCSFSPFKDVSPEPLNQILCLSRTEKCSVDTQSRIAANFTSSISYRTKQKKTNVNNLENHGKRKHKKPKNADNRKDINAEIKAPKKQIVIHQQPYHSIIDKQSIEIKHHHLHNQKNTRQLQYSDEQNRLITEFQEIHIIRKPQVLEMTLAQAFDAKCKTTRNKFQKEKEKYGHLLRQRYNKSNQLSSNRDESINLSMRLNQGTKQCPQSCRGYDRKQSAAMVNRNKENQMKNQQSVPQKIMIPFKTVVSPILSNRQKPITPKQAYKYSFKKWKQLPEVVARRKQKQKQQQLKERLCRVRAHSLQVRKNILKS